MTPGATAEGIIEIVDSHMEHALRAVSVEEGADPRDSVLVAFGGAGGLHAGRLARSLEIPKVLVPPLSGVFSAVGLLLAPPRADAARTVMTSEGDLMLAGQATEVLSEAVARYRESFGRPPVDHMVRFDCRYRGQSHELEIESEPEWRSVRDRFEEAHLRHFGFTRPGEPIELVNVRAAAGGEPPLAWPDVTPRMPEGPPQTRDGVWLRDTLPEGFRTTGPGVVVEDSSAVLLEPGDRLTVLADGTLEITNG